MSGTDRLKAILESKEYDAGVYFLCEKWEVDEVRQVTEQAELEFFYVDGSKVNDKMDFFDHAGTAMSFPEGFGRGWDGFFDLMKDLSWFSTQAYLFLYDNFQGFARQEPEDFFYAYMTIIRTVERLRSRKIPALMYVLLEEEMRNFPSDSIPKLPVFS